MKNKIPIDQIISLLKNHELTLRHISEVTGYTMPDLVAISQVLGLPPRKPGKKVMHHGVGVRNLDETKEQVFVSMQTISKLREKLHADLRRAIADFVTANPQLPLTTIAKVTETSLAQLTSIADEYGIRRGRGTASPSYPRRKLEDKFSSASFCGATDTNNKTK